MGRSHNKRKIKEITEALSEMPDEFLSSDMAHAVGISTRRASWLLKQIPSVKTIPERNNNFRVKFQYTGAST